MSVSPMVARPTEAGRSPYQKSKPLSVRPSSKDATNAAPDEAELAAGIAGDLNSQVRNKYVKDRQIGEGTYANVFLAHHRENPSQKFAIKKIKVVEHDRGLSVPAIREVLFLQELSHPNVIKLYDVFSSKDQNLNLVLEFLPLGDLEMLIRDQPKFDSSNGQLTYAGTNYGAPDIKAWMVMLGRGVWFCHENFVLHRDIKPNNLLIAPDGELKLADFGLARSFADPNQQMTYNVITRWYRPPELLFSARHYNGAVDVWSVGCIFAELVLRRPFMPGNNDLDQLAQISHTIGTPQESNWPGVTLLTNYVVADPVTPLKTRSEFLSQFYVVGQDGVDLLMLTLQLDPRKRCTAKQFLQHKYWSREPRPSKAEDLPRKGGGAAKMADDLKQRGGEVGDRKKDPVARKLDFGAMRS